jgi:SAM-dependent methyltransferase
MRERPADRRPGGGRPDWYRRLFAWLTAKGSAQHGRLLDARKRRLLGGLRGYVLEIGPGGGANLRYLADDVYWIGVEPNRFFLPYLEREAKRLGRFVELRSGTAERLPLPDRSVDAVVSSLVLCSVDDVPAALAEVRRVLRPGGRFVFLEHVGAEPGSRLRSVQSAVRPLWSALAAGCEPDRDLEAAIRSAGFASVRCEAFRLPLPLVGPHIAGVAQTRPG